MPTWPSTLPLPQAQGYSESFPSTAIRTSMEVGPAKVRRRISYNVVPLSIALADLTTTQIGTLETFYNTTCLGGALSFTYTHPRTSASVTCRFTGPPKITCPDGVNWRAEFGLEILP